MGLRMRCIQASLPRRWDLGFRGIVSWNDQQRESEISGKKMEQRSVLRCHVQRRRGSFSTWCNARSGAHPDNASAG